MKNKKRSYLKIEKTIIATAGENYETYDCSVHGVFQKRKDVDDGKCPYKCEGIVSKIDNIEELRVQFKKELGF